MARTNSPRLNLPGVVSVLVGIAAFVAMKMPIAGYGPVHIALLGVGIGVLAFGLSLMLKWGSGTPVLGVLISTGALVLVGYNNGTLPAWWAKMHPAAAKPVPAVISPAAPSQGTAATPSDDPPVPRSIFDQDIRTGPTPGASHATTPVPSSTHLPAPAIAIPAPTPSVPAIVQPPVPTLSQAHAKLSAATDAVEHSLSADPAYMQAKADVTAADEKRKAALAESGPGSPQVQDASSQWLDAKSKLKKLVDAAAEKDPTVQSAERELSEAEAALRSGNRGVGNELVVLPE